MSIADIHGDSRPAAEARVDQMIEVQGLRMRVRSIAEDASRICHDSMAHRFWRIPAQTRVLIVATR